MTKPVVLTIAMLLAAPAACVAQSRGPLSTGSTMGSTAQSVVVAAAGQEVQMTAGLESAYVLQGSPGQAYLVIDLAAAANQQQRVRPAMSVALVIDRSGSMSGDKIVNARAAATSFVQSMADGDVVAIYQYDDVVEQVSAPVVVNANSRGFLSSVIMGITPRGSTNLYGGLVAGLEALGSTAAERPVRRVILISDGLANVGPSTPGELGNVAAAGAANGISVTTIGVGLDYDETVMTTVAIRAGGRFYHLQEPAQLAQILTNELNALSSTVARGVLIELVPAPGVQVLGSSGADLIRQGDTIQLSVGDMLGQQSRQIVVPLQVQTSGPGEQALADLRLRYRPATGDGERAHRSSVRYQLAAAQTQVDQNVRPEFARAVETYRTAEAQRQAADLLRQGQSQQAAAVLRTRSETMRQRATAIGGEQGRYMFDDAEAVTGQLNRVEAAPPAPAAQRALQLDLEDAAMEAEGY